MNNVLLIITAAASLFSVAMHFLIARKRMISDVLPNFRFQRADNISNAIAKFFDAYFDEISADPKNRQKTQLAILEAELHFDYLQIDSKYYLKLREKLYEYLESEEPVRDHAPLIKISQRIIYRIRARAKDEAGISPLREEEIRKRITEEYEQTIVDSEEP